MRRYRYLQRSYCLGERTRLRTRFSPLAETRLGVTGVSVKSHQYALAMAQSVVRALAVAADTAIQNSLIAIRFYQRWYSAYGRGASVDWRGVGASSIQGTKHLFFLAADFFQ
jgi:hypothetical protein